MPRLILSTALVLGLAACTSEPDEAPEAPGVIAEQAPDSGAEMGDAPVAVGEPLAADAEIVPVASVVEQSSSYDGQTLVVEGTVSKVCQMRGCWLTLSNNAGETFRINVPKGDDGEYLFTFPMDATGATAQLAGTLAIQEESVETLRHFAEDEGKSSEEVLAITEPKRTLVFTASGARLSRA